MVDGRKILSDATGLPVKEIDGIWAEVKENHRKLNGCAKHKFLGGKIEKMGAKYTCLNCGGTQGLSDIGAYIKGYVAAGGDAQDVWPGWT
jgi:hypothetical protein